jgi:prepilin-type N-terminal cleavage/methylation domain-containing protein
MGSHPAQQTGFTLVELLIVIAILAILIALLLPAVLAAREAARRTECADHLRQVALGLHNYHSVHSVLPPGHVGTPSTWTLPNWSWSSLLLPYLEEEPLYDRLAVSSRRWVHKASQTTPTPETQSILRVFQCASDAGPALNHRKDRHAKSNYRGLTGSVTTLGVEYGLIGRRNGLFFLNSHISISKIPDGASHTAGIGECTLDPTPQGRRAALWVGMRGAIDKTVHISDAVWWLNSDPAYRLNGTASQAFSSNHPGGVGFVFADASVRFLTPATDGTVLESLAARNDGSLAHGL